MKIYKKIRNLIAGARGSAVSGPDSAVGSYSCANLPGARGGIILTEVLVAVALFVIGLLVVGTIYKNAAQITVTSKSYLIAENLATEAISAVKNIRDTNWLRRPNYPECWLSINPYGINPLCDDTNYNVGVAHALTDTDYVVTQYDSVLGQVDGKWRIYAPAGLYAGPGVNQDEFRLFVVEADNYEQYIDNLMRGSGDFSAFSEPEASPYYRIIRFTDIDDPYAMFEVIIEWYEGSRLRSITRNSTMFNYY